MPEPLESVEDTAPLDALVPPPAGSSVSTPEVTPDRAIMLGVSTRTVTALTDAASWDCGIAGEPGKFGGSLGATPGSINVGVIGAQASCADTPVLLTPNRGAVTGGAVRGALHALHPRAPVTGPAPPMDWPALIPVAVASVLSDGLSVIAVHICWHSRTVRNDADTEHLGLDALTLSKVRHIADRAPRNPGLRSTPILMTAIGSPPPFCRKLPECCSQAGRCGRLSEPVSCAHSCRPFLPLMHSLFDCVDHPARNPPT
jgi:hypothetical protein